MKQWRKVGTYGTTYMLRKENLSSNLASRNQKAKSDDDFFQKKI